MSANDGNGAGQGDEDAKRRKLNKKTTSASAAAAVPEVGGFVLKCQKCNRPTTKEASQKSGRNELLRNCNECGATDKWVHGKANPCISRKRKGIGGTTPADLTEHEKDLQLKAIATKEWLRNSKTSKAEVYAWYIQEGSKRDAEGRMSRRSLCNPKGFIDNSHQEGVINDGITGWQTYTQFAMEKMILKEANDKDGCLKLWEKALGDPKSTVKDIQGHKCLKVFSGGQTIDRTADMMNTGMRQTGVIESENDMKAFDTDVTMTMDKFRNKLNVSHRDTEHSASVQAEPKVRHIENLVEADDFSQRHKKRSPSRC